LLSYSLARFVTSSCSFKILWMSRSKLCDGSEGLIAFCARKKRNQRKETKQKRDPILRLLNLQPE
jgi:hypothetical protein